MPSALENLIKILRLEKKNNYNNKAVIGGIESYAPQWAQNAREEFRKPEQLALVDEILLVIEDYAAKPAQRADLAKYMFERMTQRTSVRAEYEVPLPDVLDQPEPPPRGASSRCAEQWREQSERGTSQRGKRGDDRPKPKPRRRSRRPDLSLDEAVGRIEQLKAPATKLSGVGDKMAEKLARLGIETIGDLLYLFPRRYDDYTQMVPLSKLAPHQTYTLIATVREIIERRTPGRKPYLIVQLQDGTGQVSAKFFNQPWLKRQLKEGMQLTLHGKTSLYLGKVELINPVWEPIDQNSLQAGGIVPIYPLTKGISARTMRRLMYKAVQSWAEKIPEYLPDPVLDRTDLVNLGWALRQIHFPERWEYLGYARERLAFDELLFLQLGVLRNRVEWQAQPGIPLAVDDDWRAAFQEALPFALTGAQERAIQDIYADLARDVPMNRLLQGDVGAGKTVVAVATLAAAVVNGKQAALMAPTTILAEQHYQNLRALFDTIPGLSPDDIGLLSSTVSAGERRAVLEGMAAGTVRVLVGTQALIQEGVAFDDLAVAVIDEQQRFGVQQRGALRGKGTNPHILVMTATPIPRTMALTLFADLDLSILDEMPPGRTPIQTRVIPPNERTRVHLFIEQNVLARGQQAYVIFPLVEASDDNPALSAEEGYEDLSQHVYLKHTVGLIHGRMKPAEKDAIMARFAAGEIDVLVATTVIEVGVDVPNATAIIVENAERFGLAQLHQLRGRVGRGAEKSYCMLIAGEVTERLQAMEDTTDGFKLAELDWQQRGAGDLLGVRQSGAGKIRLPEQMDMRLVELAQHEAKAINAEDPYLDLPEHALLARFVMAPADMRTDLS